MSKQIFKNHRKLESFFVDKMKSFLLVVFLLISSSSGVIFECNFRVQYWSHADFIYTCVAKIINSNNLRVIEDVRGNHLEDKGNLDVQGFVLSDQVLGQIPENFDEFFPEIKGIIFVGVELEHLTFYDLHQFPKLLFLRVMNNKLVRLDHDLFKYNPDLYYVDFDSNLLEATGANLLANLHFLQEADFRNNPCINKLADNPDSISYLNSLLLRNCPNSNDPSTTTEFPQCNLRCTLEAEVDSLKNQLAREAEVNQNQSEVLKFLEAERIEQNKRIEDLERRINAKISPQ